VKQAALSDGFAFDAVPFQHDDVAAPEVDVGGCEVTEALMVAAVVVMIDEAGNLPLEITWQEVVFEQDAVLQRLVPSLDLTLGLGMAGRSAGVVHALVGDSQAARSDDTYDGPLSDRSRGRWATLALWQPDACSAMVSVSVTSPAFIVAHSFQAMM